ncbi:hypothetical protein QBC47DRAFT_174988 [Echria macrotheca]|uniref:Uncharacterized protein n=1 Tax=Echria macrotheca TaxID=438768 RepID=A0AAJ0BHT5_9PEZI|nr:hypothetical protein QBC47DRAFT_174988 [Echria macrotheca]
MDCHPGPLAGAFLGVVQLHIRGDGASTPRPITHRRSCRRSLSFAGGPTVDKAGQPLPSVPSQSSGMSVRRRTPSLWRDLGPSVWEDRFWSRTLRGNAITHEPNACTAWRMYGARLTTRASGTRQEVPDHVECGPQLLKVLAGMGDLLGHLSSNSRAVWHRAASSAGRRWCLEPRRDLQGCSRFNQTKGFFDHDHPCPFCGVDV